MSEIVATSHFIFFALKCKIAVLSWVWQGWNFVTNLQVLDLERIAHIYFKNISRILVFWIQTTFMNCFNNMSFCSGVPAWSAFHLFEDERTHLLKQANKKKRLSNYFWSGGEKKVSKDVPGFTCNWWVCLSNENVWVWWGLQLVQPGRSKTLYGLHGLQPGQKNGARSAPVPGVTSVGVCSISAGEMRFIPSQGCLEEAERLHCSGTSF